MADSASSCIGLISSDTGVRDPAVGLDAAEDADDAPGFKGNAAGDAADDAAGECERSTAARTSARESAASLGDCCGVAALGEGGAFSAAAVAFAA